MKKDCLNCGKDLSETRAGSKFCSGECRGKYHYRKNKKKILPLSGFAEGKENKNLHIEPVEEIRTDTRSEFAEEKKKSPKVNTGLAGLRNTILFIPEQVDLELPQRKPLQKETVKKTPPAEFLEKIHSEPNPGYQVRMSLLKSNEKSRVLLVEKIKNLEAELKWQISRSGKAWVIGGAIAGATVALLYEKNEKPEEGDLTLLDKTGKKIAAYPKKGKRKNLNNSEPSFATRIGLLVLGTAIGTGFGFLGKTLTKSSREADKAQKIEALNKELTKLKKELELAELLKQDAARFLENEPEFITRTEKTPNPDFEIYMNNLKAQKRILEKEENSSLLEDDLLGLFGGDSGLKHEEKKEFKPKSDKITSAKEFGKEPSLRLNFDGCWREFFDLPSVNFHCLVHGNPGEGKSTFCMWFARYLAENFGRVLYVSGEEGRNPTFQDKVKYCKADVDNLYIADIRTGEEFLKEVRPDEFHFIVLDSLHDMDISPDMMKEIKERYKNTAFIAVEQNNKKGELYGTNQMMHTFDVVINVVNYTAETTKNRFKQRGMSLPTAVFGKDFEKGGTGLKIIYLKRPGTGDSDAENQDEDTKKIV